MRFSHIFLFLLFVLPQVGLLTSCDPDTEIRTGNDIALEFSVDTLLFDTVFTARGSATRSFRVYNRSEEAIQIDRISVAGTTGVEYTFNVDGRQGPEVTDAVIWAEDSIWVFVEVEVDPTDPVNVSPFVAEDQIVFETGDNRAEVILQAFGQNAIYLGERSGIAGITCNGGTEIWDSELPYVIRGRFVIDNCVLQVPEGRRIYITGGIARDEDIGIFNDGVLIVNSNASLQILGTREDPVIIQTDRLEPRFQEEVGQYRGIFLVPESQNNIISHAQLLHGIEGLVVDSLAEVDIDNSIIAYTAGAALRGKNARVTARNSIFHSNFGDAILFIQGVRLDMDHCTVASYGSDARTLALQNFECFDPSDPQCTDRAESPIIFNARNSIFAGPQQDEIIFVDGFDRNPINFRVNMENCVVRVSERFASDDTLFPNFFTELCQGCYNLQFGDDLFLDLDEDDYRLDTMSVAIGLGQLIPGLEEDIEGNLRVEPAAAGAYAAPIE
ncbi:MAG: hypothetical protein AAF741_19165 [Bacteroidota bacterium]